MEQKITLYRIGKDGTYRQIQPIDGRFVSKVLSGFWIDPDWLWQSPRLLQADVLDLMTD